MMCLVEGTKGPAIGACEREPALAVTFGDDENGGAAQGKADKDGGGVHARPPCRCAPTMKSRPSPPSARAFAASRRRNNSRKTKPASAVSRRMPGNARLTRRG